MSHRTARFLMLWFFVVLQTMTPFIHAHAGAVQLNHDGGLPHLHQGEHGDASYHTIAAHEHGAEVAVARGVPQRMGAQRMVRNALCVATPIFQHADTRHSRADFPPPPALYLVPSNHTFYLALAPPSA